MFSGALSYDVWWVGGVPEWCGVVGGWPWLCGLCVWPVCGALVCGGGPVLGWMVKVWLRFVFGG